MGFLWLFVFWDGVVLLVVLFALDWFCLFNDLLLWLFGY